MPGVMSLKPNDVDARFIQQSPAVFPISGGSYRAVTVNRRDDADIVTRLSL